MNIRDLQYLVAVYDCGNFSRAAVQCNVSQPTLSGQLKKLEKELGGELMERTTRRVFFTNLGEQVVKKARGILLSTDQIKHLVDRSDGPLVGDFHLGLIPTVGPFLLPAIMPEISKQFSRMNLFLYELQTRELLDGLNKGKLDAVIVAKLDWDYQFSEQHLYIEKIMLAVNSDDPLARRVRPVNMSALEGKSVLMLEDGHCLRDQALGVCCSAGAHEDVRFRATSMDTLLHMVGNGIGMTLVPEMACSKKPGVRYLKLSKPQPSRDVVMLTRHKSSRASALQTIASLISEIVS